MQRWERVKERATATLTVWSQNAPTMRVGGKGPADLESLIDGFEPLAQAVVAAQDAADAAHRSVRLSLETLKLLGYRVPQIIEGQLAHDAGLLAELRKIYRTSPRTVATILERARALYPIWLLANEAMAALTPPQPPLTRNIQQVPHTAAMLKTLMDGYSDLVTDSTLKAKLLAARKAALDTLAATTDALSKRWFKVMSHSFDPGSAEHKALDGITTEAFARVPVALEIRTVKQGGLQGRQALVSYAKSGGDHATRAFVKWQVVGVDADFAHEQPLEKTGNALGPFAPDTVLRIITEVANSVGSRTSAPRSIVIEESIG